MLGRQILDKIYSGRQVAIHCKAGIGRSGMISATILILDGMEPLQALNLLEKQRTRKVPDTQEQRQWILDLPSQIHR